MFKRQNTTVILQDLFSSKFHLEVSCMKQEPWKPIAKIKTIFTSYYNINATFSKTESNMLAREVVFQHNVKKLHVCTRTFQNCFCNMHNNNCNFLQLTFFFKKVFILSRSLYVSCVGGPSAKQRAVAGSCSCGVHMSSSHFCCCCSCSQVSPKASRRRSRRRRWRLRRSSETSRSSSLT